MQKHVFENMGISERTERTSISKITSTGVIGNELRSGRQYDVVKLRYSEIRKSISEHIDRYPKIESHYCRTSSTKEY